MRRQKVIAMTRPNDYSKIDLAKCCSKSQRRCFIISCRSRSYTIETPPWTTIDLAWASQKCWFMPGSIVTIIDDKGNFKTFEKE